MNIQQLRQSLKMKWLGYYQQNRHWLVKMRVWGSYDGLRRPSSGFILATLSVLEPEFEQMLAFMMDLNNNPDAIAIALGLNFNPDEELGLTSSDDDLVMNESQSEFLAESPVEEKLVRSLCALSSAKIQYTEEVTSDLPQAHKPLPAFAVATKVNSLPGKSRQNKPLALTATVPRNGKTIALAVEVPHHSRFTPRNIVAPRQITGAIAPVVPSHRKNLPSLSTTGEISLNRKPQPFPTTNASNLASWVDEFCQGKAKEWGAGGL